MAEELPGAASDLGGRSLIVGLGASGASAARYVHAHGGTVRIVDSRASPPGLAALGGIDAEIVTESLDPRWLHDVRRLVLSPGLSIDLPICAAARERGIEIVNDVELFARVCELPLLAVTGSNGKSTVATLLGRMLAAAGLRAPAGGNLGVPALDLLAEPADVYVLEISSFQMEAADSLAPRAAAVLNVSADHLDRHASLATYAALKEKLLRNAASAIVNLDDPIVAAMGERHPHAVPFSIERELSSGYSLVDATDGASLAIDGRPVLSLSEMRIHGRHNAANALAALALADTMTAATPALLQALAEFPGLPHRCEFVAEIGGVVYVNDSKATNIGAAVAALAGLPGPIVLLAGGIGKGADFAELRAAAAAKLRAAVVLGTAAEDIALALQPVCPVYRAASMAEAVRIAQAQALAGDTVLLAPACSSLDMFADYAARGRAFAAAVAELQR